MSFTSTVPAAVPSLFQSSRPFVGSEATKKSVPFTSVNPSGEESSVAVLMSFTRYGTSCARAGPRWTVSRRPTRSKRTGHFAPTCTCRRKPAALKPAWRQVHVGAKWPVRLLLLDREQEAHEEQAYGPLCPYMHLAPCGFQRRRFPPADDAGAHEE